MRTLEEICTDLVTQRERLAAFAMLNANVPLEDAIAREISQTQARIAVARLEREQRAYMAWAVEQAAAFGG